MSDASASTLLLHASDGHTGEADRRKVCSPQSSSSDHVGWVFQLSGRFALDFHFIGATQS